MNLPDFDLQGHRGARGLRPENTIEAFDLALSLGVTTLEMDVVISNDMQVIVSHDPYLSSEICSHADGTPVTTEEETALRIFGMSYDDVKTFDCGSRRYEEFPNQIPSKTRKPLLADVLRFADARVIELGREPVFFNIETKSTPEGDGVDHPPPEIFADLVLRAVEHCGVSDRVIIQSFDTRTLLYSRQSGLPVRIALLVGDSTPGDFDSQIRSLGFTPDIYSPSFGLVNQSLMSLATAEGVDILPWTVNIKTDMERVISLGVCGLITDYPNQAIEVLRQRGFNF